MGSPNEGRDKRRNCILVVCKLCLAIHLSVFIVLIYVS